MIRVFGSTSPYQNFSAFHVWTLYGHASSVFFFVSRQALASLSLMLKKNTPKMHRFVPFTNLPKTVYLKGIPGWWFQYFFIFSPRKLGKMPILPNIFEMGWFNHQLDPICLCHQGQMVIHHGKSLPKARSGKKKLVAVLGHHPVDFFRTPPKQPLF